MRPKARGLVQHGGPPGCMAGGELPSKCDFVRVGLAVPPAFSIPYRFALTGAAQLRADGISGAVMYTYCTFIHIL